MNRILTYGLAAVATTLLSQSVYADNSGRGGGGGGGRSDGGGARSSAPAVHAAPAMHANVGHASVARAMRAPSAPRVATQAQAQFNQRAAVAQSRPRTQFTPSVAQNRPGHNAPSIAFGGHSIANDNAAVNAQNARGFSAATSPGGRRNGFAFAPSVEMSRGWDRGRVHTWNHHHYRWSNNNWIIADGGFYDSPYDYSDDIDQGGAPYASPAYAYDNSTSSDSIAQSVQDQLTRLGYSPGPVDGVFGPQTRDAIMDFQNDHRLPVTGQIDGPLMRALGL